VTAVAFGCLAAGAGWAADVVKTQDGKVEGQVSAMSPTEVTVAQGGSSKKVPVNQIESITFEEDPALVRRARESAQAGRHEEALKALENVKMDDIQRAEIKQDIEFFAALSSAKLALDGKLEIPDAGKRMTAFVAAYPQSYHYLEACETVGELLMALGQFSKARDYYERVGKAPWPEYKLRAAVSVGQILLAEKKPDEALKYFQHVLDAKPEGEQAAAQRSVAMLGKARCLVETGKPDEAIKLVDGIIAKAEADDADLLGRAYLVLGIALRKAGRAQDAMYALLHVDTMYSANRDAHAESLANLVPLFTELKKEDRAKETKRLLNDQYGDTRWGQAAE
jgi:tetratricopeptide (TPR) repeat protein